MVLESTILSVIELALAGHVGHVAQRHNIEFRRPVICRQRIHDGSQILRRWKLEDERYQVVN